MNLKSQIMAYAKSHSVDPVQLQMLLSLNDSDLNTFAEAIDESLFPLHEWIEALNEFAKWEVAESRNLKMIDKIEYLSCCAQGVSTSGKLLSLTMVWKDYVMNYGVGG